MGRYLKSNYNMTQEDYYKQIVYNDKNFKVRCYNPECKESATFINLSSGFNLTCGSEECRKVRSREIGKQAFTNFWNSSPEIIEERVDRMTSHFQDPEIRAEADYNRAMTYTDPKYAIVDFYIAKHLDWDDWIKFGVSYLVPRRDRNYTDWRILIRGKREVIYNLEYQLKLIFKGEWIKSSEVLIFTREFLKLSKDLESLPFKISSKRIWDSSERFSKYELYSSLFDQ